MDEVHIVIRLTNGQPSVAYTTEVDSHDDLLRGLAAYWGAYNILDIAIDGVRHNREHLAGLLDLRFNRNSV